MKEQYFHTQIGKDVIIRIIDLVQLSGFDNVKKKEILNIIDPFILNSDDMDLMTICKLEAIFGEKIIYVPTKQQWRRIKLERLNKICNEE